MFPIIPHHFATNKSHFLSSSETLSGRQGLVNVKIKSEKNEIVIAGCDIPVDTVSEIIFSKDIVCCDSDKNQKQIVVLLNERLQLVPELRSVQSSELLHRLQFSNDCHSYNVHLCLTTIENQHNLILKTVKPIKAGQQLLMWFSEEALAALQMAFLTPANIHGQKQYVCHKCHAQFEYPNPLKLHLTLNCDHYPKFHLWNRLKTTLQTRDTPDHNTCVPLNLSSNFKFELKPSHNGVQIKNDNILPATSTKEETKHVKESSSSPENISLKRRGSCDSLPFAPSTSPPFSVLSTVRPSSEPTGHVTHPSAFRPYPSKLLNNFNFSSNNNSIGITTRSILNLPHLQPNLINTLTNPDISYTHAAQMETLVSSLGKSKQGHLCIYCGKVYSRKYGLKIHIRTHTGFKPLKCKYCLRPFGDPSNLNKHVRLHAEGETPYKCELCGKILVRRRDLERHLKSRHSLDIHHRSQGDETTEDQ